MDKQKIIENLLISLQKQNFTFENSIPKTALEDSFSCYKGIKQAAVHALRIIGAFNDIFVSCDKLSDTAFISDYNRMQQDVDERMLFTYTHKLGSLLIIGIIEADDLSENELKSIFARLDNSVTETMRFHVAKMNGTKMGTYCTMLLLFEDSEKAKRFNNSIKDFYSSHLLKKTYISTISIDCKAENLTQGKGSAFTKWNGGIDINELKKELFR